MLHDVIHEMKMHEYIIQNIFCCDVLQIHDSERISLFIYQHYLNTLIVLDNLVIQ